MPNKLLRICIFEFLDDIQEILHLMWWVPQQPPSPLTTTTLRNADMFEIHPTETAPVKAVERASGNHFLVALCIVSSTMPIVLHQLIDSTLFNV